eukprot:scaffold20587_cov110-Isochrysis_galbana.AAC.3
MVIGRGSCHTRYAMPRPFALTGGATACPGPSPRRSESTRHGASARCSSETSKTSSKRKLASRAVPFRSFGASPRKKLSPLCSRGSTRVARGWPPGQVCAMNSATFISMLLRPPPSGLVRLTRISEGECLPPDTEESCDSCRVALSWSKLSHLSLRHCFLNASCSPPVSVASVPNVTHDW